MNVLLQFDLVLDQVIRDKIVALAYIIIFECTSIKCINLHLKVQQCAAIDNPR